MRGPRAKSAAAPVAIAKNPNAVCDGSAAGRRAIVVNPANATSERRTIASGCVAF